jgi:hypothetical protein
MGCKERVKEGILVQTNVKIWKKMTLIRGTWVYHQRWEMDFFKESNAFFKKKVEFVNTNSTGPFQGHHKSLRDAEI